MEEIINHLMRLSMICMVIKGADLLLAHYKIQIRYINIIFSSKLKDGFCNPIPL